MPTALEPALPVRQALTLDRVLAGELEGAVSLPEPVRTSLTGLITCSRPPSTP